MTSQPADSPSGHEQTRLGGEAAVIVPLDEYRVLVALRDRATPEDVEEAALDAAIAEHEAWKASGRPGGTVPHETVVAELSGGDAPG